jgi:SpoVK/Ycf46/Vps4 family AAA+-type ATPase
MKPVIKEVTKAVESLLKLAERFERGQCIPWNEVEAISGTRFENRGKHIIKKFRSRMERDRNIVILPAFGVGIRLLTHRETAAEIPALRQKRAYRQIRRAIKQTATVDTSRLSDHERRLLAAQRQNMAETRRDLFRSQRDARKPMEMMPLRKAKV